MRTPETVTPLGPQPPDRLAPLEPSESSCPPASISQPAPSQLRMSPHLPDPVPPVATASHAPPHSQARRRVPLRRSPTDYSHLESATESVPISRREQSVNPHGGEQKGNRREGSQHSRLHPARSRIRLHDLRQSLHVRNRLLRIGIVNDRANRCGETRWIHR